MKTFVRRIGPVLLACVATAAAMAPAAHAQGEFTAAEYPASVTSETETTFSLNGWDVICANTHMEGKWLEASATARVGLSHFECVTGLTATTASMNGCELVLHAGETSAEGKYAGSTDIDCPEGSAITLEGLNCKAEIGSQTGVESVSYTNGVSDIDMSLNLEQLSYAITVDGLLCPALGTGEFTDGVYTGSGATLQGTNKFEESIAVSVSD
jgi:hypothetical protein